MPHPGILRELLQRPPLSYAPDLTVHHAALAVRDSPERRVLGLRNALWSTWLRRPWPSALCHTTQAA